MTLWDFVKKYYIDSIVYKQGYNPVNTVTWAAILIVAVYLLYRYLESRFEFDERFVFSNIPYIVLGSSVRIIEDSGILQPPVSYLFMSPMIYVLIFLVTFPVLIISRRIAGREYYKMHAAVGSVLSASVLLFLFLNLKIVNGWVLPAGLALAALFAVIASFVFPETMRNPITIFAFFSQTLDGLETFFGIEFLNYSEMHVVPRLLIEHVGAWSFPLVKVLAFLVVLYIIDTSEEGEQLRNFVKFVVIVLGLAPGLRDGLRMLFSV